MCVLTRQKSELCVVCDCKKSLINGLKQAFEIFGCITCKSFEVFDEMGLIKEVVFVTKFGKGFGLSDLIEHRVEAYNGSKFFGSSTDQFAETFFERALADAQFFGQLFDAKLAIGRVDFFYGLNDQLIGLDIFELFKQELLHDFDALLVSLSSGEFFFRFGNLLRGKKVGEFDTLAKQFMGWQCRKMGKTNFGEINQNGANIGSVFEDAKGVGKAANASSGQG